jgi:pimeloyl-ACP methyl ester carboxylesterase
MQIQVKNFLMAYDDHGAGLPVLFIHGFPLNRRIWNPQLKDLHSARLLAPDLRGHGESQNMPAEFSMDQYADDLAAFLDAVGVTSPVLLCGLSMGGYIAFAFYRKYRSRVKGLILTATRAGADTPEGKANRDKASALAQVEGVQAIVNSMLPKMLAPQTYSTKPELVQLVENIMMETTLEGVISDLAGLKERTDSTTTLGQIYCPTLIIHGEQDQIIPIEEAEAMHLAIRGSQLELIPNAGHLLNMEQPGLFNQAVDQFLKNLQ